MSESIKAKRYPAGRYYTLNVPIAHIILARMATRYIKDHRDREALQYFGSLEFQHWFDISKKVMLRFIKDCPADRLEYALAKVKPRSEKSQKALLDKRRTRLRERSSHNDFLD